MSRLTPAAGRERPGAASSRCWGSASRATAMPRSAWTPQGGRRRRWRARWCGSRGVVGLGPAAADTSRMAERGHLRKLVNMPGSAGAAGLSGELAGPPCRHRAGGRMLVVADANTRWGTRWRARRGCGRDPPRRPRPGGQQEFLPSWSGVSAQRWRRAWIARAWSLAGRWRRVVGDLAGVIAPRCHRSAGYGWCRCPPRCWRWWTARSGARPRLTPPWPRTWWEPSRHQRPSSKPGPVADTSRA